MAARGRCGALSTSCCRCSEGQRPVRQQCRTRPSRLLAVKRLGIRGASSLGSDSREGLALHPTVKPRLLLEDALIDVTNRGDVVIDCFAGSGSTVLAAEATGRRCRAIEFDGPYCDVIIRRWCEMTGREAVLEATGETFAEVEARRQEEGGGPGATVRARRGRCGAGRGERAAEHQSDRRHPQ
jgi:hypothetical protein